MERFRQATTQLRLRLLLGMSATVKQASIVFFFAIAVLISIFTPGQTPVDSGLLVTAVLLILLATLLASVFTASAGLRRFHLIVPAVDMVAVGLLVAATAGDQYNFGALVILPGIWFAAEEGARYIGYATLGVCLAFVIPILLGREVLSTPSEIWRGIFAQAVLAVAAAFINELSRQARHQLAVAQRREEAAAAELSRAAAVQRALFPKDEELLADYHLAGACVPSRSVGGDFFDWYPVSGGVAVTMGDVMGKGVGAGMIAATARAVLRSAAFSPDPAVALTRMALCLNTELKEAVSFLTLFHARLDESTGVLTYVDAGHGLTVLVRADGSFEPLMSTDFPIGIDPDFHWSTRQASLNPGDTLVTFSDGVLDLYGGSLIALERVASIVHSTPTAHDAVDAVMAVAQLQHNPDDVTVLMLRRDPIAVGHHRREHPERIEELMITVGHGIEGQTH